ncbi:MAG: DNA mismatch repair protein [Clostridia bacterium]|nr:DNA mismatch repair protein [Clostridia bacterium]
MPDFSLLYPQGVKPSGKTLSDDAVNDLSVEMICEKLTGELFEQNIIKNIMINIEKDPKVISYRRDVFDDLYRFPKLRERIKELLEELAYLKDLEKATKDPTASPVWQLVNRLHELDIYVTCISEIHKSLDGNDIRSDGLKQLRDFVSSVYNESGFEYLHDDIKDLVSEISQIKSLSLGVNLDNRLMPSEVGILAINDKPFARPGLLNKFLDFSSVKKNGIHIGTDIRGMTKIHTVGKVTGDDPLMNNLSRVVTEMLSTTVKQLKSKLAKYTNVSGYGLIKMIPEFIFYIRWADFIQQLMDKNVPLCKPEIIDDGSHDLYVKGLYNFKLAIRRMTTNKDEEIILNDFEFTKEHGIYIMTGPNRGGKTTFTQAVGLLFLMAQAGIYVPAESARLAPVDCIYTHFPADENKTVDLGRLGEESQRMSEIFSVATNESLLLFNESLATTSFAEGLYIAKDVVRALRYLGARTIFNTHMHELAMSCAEVNSQIKGELDIASLITGIHEGKRSYKIFLAPPEGVSYAQDIAKKYGVTFDQLSERIHPNG